MTKTAKATASVPKSVSIRYDLLDLPTAQHKAGLAGLLLQVESMKARGLPPESVPRVELMGPTTVEATFTEASLCGLFDDLYDATTVEVRSSQKWQKKEPKRVEQADVTESVVEGDNEAGGVSDGNRQGATSSGGKRPKTKQWFVYDVTQPQGHFWRQFTDDGKEIWHKLWRDMLWAVPRGKPTTRRPFDNRAAGKSSGEGEALWKDLLVSERKRQKGEIHTCEVAGAILLGAQALSAESVPFRDRVDRALLLHFWQLTARVFVPEQFDADGHRDFAGYVLAIPEVADCRHFVRRYTRVLETLSSKASGYRPVEAVISLPAEGALEFMDGLARLVGAPAAVARALAGVEFFHMVKIGNNVKTMAHDRIATIPDLLMDYEAIKDTCRNPLFRTARLLALLHDQVWYAEFGAMMAERPWPLFVQSERSPRNLPSFPWDAARRFRVFLQSEQQRKAYAMKSGSSSPPATLETLVYRLVRTYVRTKTEQKSGITYASFKGSKVKSASGRERVDYPRAYTEAREKVCSDLFLGLRSRRDDDFVNYFTGTVGSIAQGPNLSDETDFGVIAQALLDENRRRDVQVLAMLAASAASYASTTVEERDDAPQREEGPQ